jgi:putative oxidoreductase
MSGILRLLGHPLLALIFRLYLGGLFVYASMYKINYAAEFASTIASYQLVPWWSVNFLAVAMPWFELVCGLLFLAGVRVRTVGLAMAGLLALFTVAIFVNLLRDAPISCGCFHSLEDAISWRTVIRDLAWMAMALHATRFDSWLQLDKLFLQGFKEIEA